MDLNVQILSNESQNILYSADNPYELPLRVDGFSSEKELESFIKTSERMIRFSPEYKFWVSFLTDTLGHRECVLTKEVMSECNIVIHHHPINLYTICKSVITKMITDQTKFCSFDICTKVIELHFQNKVGYMPLLSDIHEKYHNGFQKLPIEFVHGNYKYFLENMPLDDDERSAIYSLCNVKLEDCVSNWRKNLYPGIEEAAAVNE